MLPSCTACINLWVNFIYILTIYPDHVVWKELEMFFIIAWLRVFCSQVLLLKYRTWLWRIFSHQIDRFPIRKRFLKYRTWTSVLSGCSFVAVLSALWNFFLPKKKKERKKQSPDFIHCYIIEGVVSKWHLQKQLSRWGDVKLEVQWLGWWSLVAQRAFR